MPTLWDKDQVIEYILGAYDLPEPGHEPPRKPRLQQITFISNITGTSFKEVVDASWLTFPNTVERYQGMYTFQFSAVTGYNTPTNKIVIVE